MSLRPLKIAFGRVGDGALPSFDLVVATLGRSDELARLLDSLERQTHQGFRLIVVDQNADDRVETLLAARTGLDFLRLSSAPGLSRARNVALGHLTADVVAFPDDDCFYPDDLLERVARRLAGQPGLDGVSGKAVDPDGRPGGRWREAPFTIARDTVWYSGNSHTIFLRRRLVEQVGAFDESLGLGSGTPWHSGEEIDFVARAVALGARIEYDPRLVVLHPVKPLSRAGRRALGRRDGASVGYILGKNRYPLRALARMLIRPAGGAGLSLLRRDVAEARFQVETLRGRVLGYRAGRRT
jgi:glycosyltransferase involved in cell wall biosynthesis